jgi:hypothetical protein
MTDPKTIAAQLSEAQKAYVRSYYGGTKREGRPHGLVARNLLGYRWGMNASMGYRETSLGREVFNFLEGSNG